MGSLLDSRLRQPPRSPWEAQPVGNLPMPGESSATLLVEKPGWQFEYGAEVPVSVRLHELERFGLPGRAEALFWSGISVRISKRAFPELAKGNWHLTAALRPRSFHWQVSAPLRPGLDRASTPDWETGLRRLATGDASLRDLPFDPFEPDPDQFVARLADPARPHWHESEVEDLHDGYLVVRNPNRRGRAGKREKDQKYLLPRKWYFGLCPAPPEKLAERLEVALEPEVEAIWNRIDKGKIKLRPQNVRGHSCPN